MKFIVLCIGLLGILSGTLLCYLGVQAGHSFAYSTSVRRVCTQWLVSGFICGLLGLVLSKGGHSESWIPINKNLWSLTFIFILAGLAFIILTILYLLVDVYKWFTGEPWLWLGMNSIVLYVGHEVAGRFPIQFEVDQTHPKLLAMHLYGAVVWSLIAGIMYFKKVFIAI
jgi:heparan-alpha-glucosaminide N-acetyltransferase